jgi:hypothetical protein
MFLLDATSETEIPTTIPETARRDFSHGNNAMLSRDVAGAHSVGAPRVKQVDCSEFGRRTVLRDRRNSSGPRGNDTNRGPEKLTGNPGLALESLVSLSLESSPGQSKPSLDGDLNGLDSKTRPRSFVKGRILCRIERRVLSARRADWSVATRSRIRVTGIEVAGRRAESNLTTNFLASPRGLPAWLHNLEV